MWWIELGWLLATTTAARARTRAQSTVEYALVGALVVIAAAGAMTVLGGELTAVFTNISSTLRTAAAGH